MQYYYTNPPKPPAYVQILEHQREEHCERLANGTIWFVDVINCASRLLDPWANVGSAIGSTASIAYNRTPVSVVGTTGATAIGSGLIL